MTHLGLSMPYPNAAKLDFSYRKCQECALPRGAWRTTIRPCGLRTAQQACHALSITLQSQPLMRIGYHTQCLYVISSCCGNLGAHLAEFVLQPSWHRLKFCPRFCTHLQRTIWSTPPRRPFRTGASLFSIQGAENTATSYVELIGKFARPI